jgi:hypothetical protein
LENLKEGGHLEKLDIKGSIILKQEYDVRLWDGFNSLGVGSSR